MSVLRLLIDDGVDVTTPASRARPEVTRNQLSLPEPFTTVALVTTRSGSAKACPGHPPAGSLACAHAERWGAHPPLRESRSPARRGGARSEERRVGKEWRGGGGSE